MWFQRFLLLIVSCIGKSNPYYLFFSTFHLPFRFLSVHFAGSLMMYFEMV
jgi:hypothetical protein